MLHTNQSRSNRGRAAAARVLAEIGASVNQPHPKTNWQSLHARVINLTPAQEIAMLSLLHTAVSVCERHQARGDAWCSQSAQEQQLRAQAHLERATYRDEDGMSEASHAACRLAFLLWHRPDLVPGTAPPTAQKER